MADTVNRPPHYTAGSYEVLDVIEDWFSDNYLRGQVLKYIARAGKKDDELEDLRKAKFYLEREITNLEEDLRFTAEPKPRVWKRLVDVPKDTMVDPANDKDFIYVTEDGGGWYIDRDHPSKPSASGWTITDTDASDHTGPFTEVIL